MGDKLGAILAGLKYASVLITGSFGILSLLVDYRDRETKRITRWGKIAVIGVISSTVVGSLSQSIDFELNRRASIVRQNQYEESLRQFSRLLLPLTPERVEVEFTLPPESVKPSEPNTVSLAGHALDVKNLVDSVSLDFRLFKTRPSIAEINRLPGQQVSPFHFLILGQRNETYSGVSTSSNGLHSLSISRDVQKDHIWSSGSGIFSIPDIPGTYMVLEVYAANNYIDTTPEEASRIFAQLKPTMLILRIGTIQIKIPPEKLTPSGETSSIYVYAFPGTLEELFKMVE